MTRKDMTDFFFCFSEAANKTAEQLNGLTVGGEKVGAKGEGMLSATVLLELEIRSLVLILSASDCGNRRLFVAKGLNSCQYLNFVPFRTPFCNLLA